VVFECVRVSRFEKVRFDHHTHDARGKHGSHEEQSAPTIREQVRLWETVCDCWTRIGVERPDYIPSIWPCHAQ